MREEAKERDHQMIEEAKERDHLKREDAEERECHMREWWIERLIDEMIYFFVKYFLFLQKLDVAPIHRHLHLTLTT